MADLISRAAALDAIDGMKPMQGSMEQLAMKALCWAAVKTIQPVDAIPVEWLESKRKEALHEGMRPDEVEAVEMVLWMWQKEQEAR